MPTSTEGVSGRLSRAPSPWDPRVESPDTSHQDGLYSLLLIRGGVAGLARVPTLQDMAASAGMASVEAPRQVRLSVSIIWPSGFQEGPADGALDDCCSLAVTVMSTWERVCAGKCTRASERRLAGNRSCRLPNLVCAIGCRGTCPADVRTAVAGCVGNTLTAQAIDVEALLQRADLPSCTGCPVTGDRPGWRVRQPESGSFDSRNMVRSAGASGGDGPAPTDLPKQLVRSESSALAAFRGIAVVREADGRHGQMSEPDILQRNLVACQRRRPFHGCGVPNDR